VFNGFKLIGLDLNTDGSGARFPIWKSRNFLLFVKSSDGLRSHWLSLGLKGATGGKLRVLRSASPMRVF